MRVTSRLVAIQKIVDDYNDIYVRVSAIIWPPNCTTLRKIFFISLILLKRSMILIELLPLGIRVDRGNGIEIEDSMKEEMKVSRAGNAVEKILDR